MKLSNIDLIVCLCVDRREKEIEHLKKIIDKVGLDVRFFISGNGKNPNFCYDYIDDINLNSFNNHSIFNRLVINWTVDQNARTVLFLEDDVTITKDYWEVLNKVEYPEKWNRINIGGFCAQRGLYQSYDGDAIYSPYLLRSSCMDGFFGTLINGCDLVKDENNVRHCMGEDFGRHNNRTHYKYILQPPVIIERNIPSAIRNKQFPRGIFEQAKREGRLFESDQVVNTEPVFDTITQTFIPYIETEVVKDKKIGRRRYINK